MKRVLLTVSVFFLTACSGGHVWQKEAGVDQAVLQADAWECRQLTGREAPTDLGPFPIVQPPVVEDGSFAAELFLKRTRLFDKCMAEKGWHKSAHASS